MKKLLCVLLLAGCEQKTKTFVVDDRACYERCVLAATTTRGVDFDFNLNACVYRLCKGHWEER